MFLSSFAPIESERPSSKFIRWLVPSRGRYCVVGVLASLTGAVVGAKTAQKLGLVQIYIFVGTTLLVCGVIATIPMFLK